MIAVANSLTYIVVGHQCMPSFVYVTTNVGRYQLKSVQTDSVGAERGRGLRDPRAILEVMTERQFMLTRERCVSPFRFVCFF